MMAFKSGISREFESETKTVVVSAVLETTGQGRFGDGTDINITITEKDVVAGPGGGVEKAVFAGTKRRGVDRRAMHELRNRYWDGDCSIPSLCGLCPTCLLLGFTGTTSEIEEIKKMGVNCKSRILYATAYSVQPAGNAVTTHSRNQVNERSQTTAGSAGIHTEEVIVGGTDFPTYTTLHHVLDWEIGAFAHAFLENVNQGRYSAASRAQGGMRFPEAGGEPMVVVDVSEPGIFPLSPPKVPAHERTFAEVTAAFEGAGSEEALKERLERLGFSLENNDGSHVWKRGDSEVGRRYVGDAAVSYLRSRQGDFVDFLSEMKNGGGDAFSNGAREYFAFVSRKKAAEE
jgi:hypothetical protein